MQSIPFFHMPHKRAAQRGAAAKGAAQEAAQASLEQLRRQQQDLLRSQQAMNQPQRRPDGMRSRQEVTAGQQLLDSTLSGMGPADDMLEVGVPQCCLATVLSVNVGLEHVNMLIGHFVVNLALRNCSVAAVMLQGTLFSCMSVTADKHADSHRDDAPLQGAAGLGGIAPTARGSSVRTQSMPVRQRSPPQQDFQPLLAGVHASPGLQRDMASTGSMYCFDTAGALQSAFSRQQAHQRMLQTLPCLDMSGLAPGMLAPGTLEASL